MTRAAEITRSAWATPRAQARGVAFLATLASLFVLTSLPGKMMPNPNIPFWDKWAHGLAYLTLGVFLWRWLSAWRDAPSLGWRFFAVWGFCSAWGVLDEAHQLMVPRRSCDPVDMIVDSLGGLLAAGLCYLLARGPLAALLDADPEGFILRALGWDRASAEGQAETP
jgi:VanZ family protein